MSDRSVLANEVIEELGGTSKVAELMGVKMPSVSYWRTHGLPPFREYRLRVEYPHLRAWALAPAQEAPK